MDHSLIAAAEPKRNITGAFAFDCPIHVFEKANAPEGKRRRIGGICTTDSVDRQGENILQAGLEWEDFVQNGWFNDNHLNGTTDVLGYPDKQDGILSFKVGDILPDGTQAVANGTWVEGWLLPTKKADEIWDLATALQGTGRSLGFSVEGNIVKRSGTGNKTIAKAKIRNVAITNCFPGETKVSGSAEAITRRQYSGPMVDIELACGQKLSGTPNHPVLTQRGWVALGLLNEGKDSVAYRKSDAIASPLIAHDIDYVPPTIEETFHSALNSGAARGVRMGSKPDFHGDGTGTEVDVVLIEGTLQNSFDTAFLKHFGQDALPAADKTQILLSKLGSCAAFFEANFGASSGAIGGERILSALFGSKLGAASQLFLTPTARDTVALGNVEDTLSRETIAGGDSGRTLSSAISFSDLTLKRIRDFSGHVYNLQTAHGWYEADSIIAHNCPVNTDAKLEILARSLAAIDAEEARKAMGGGDALPNANVPMTGNDGGAPIRPERVEGDVHDTASGTRKRKRKKNVQKGLSTSEAIAYVRARVPGASDVLCQQVVHLTQDMLGAGIL